MPSPATAKAPSPNRPVSEPRPTPQQQPSSKISSDKASSSSRGSPSRKRTRDATGLEADHSQRQRQKLGDGSAKEVPSADTRSKTLTHWPELRTRRTKDGDQTLSVADLRTELKRYRAELRGYVKEIQAGAVLVGLVENIRRHTESYMAFADRMVPENVAARERTLDGIETLVFTALRTSADHCIAVIRSTMVGWKGDEVKRNKRYDDMHVEP